MWLGGKVYQWKHSSNSFGRNEWVNRDINCKVVDTIKEL